MGLHGSAITHLFLSENSIANAAVPHIVEALGQIGPDG
jgi:hypothetical protein